MRVEKALMEERGLPANNPYTAWVKASKILQQRGLLTKHSGR